MKLLHLIFISPILLLSGIGHCESLTSSHEKLALASQKKEYLTVPVSLYVLNIKRDDLIVNLSTTDSSDMEIPWAELKSDLTNFLIPSYLAALEKKTFVKNKIRWIYLKNLNYKNFKTIYLESDVSLRMSIAPSLLKAEVISLKNSDWDFSKELVKPGAVSGYLNFNLNEAYQSGDVTNSGRQKLNLRHDGAINIKDYVLQAEGTIQESTPYQRGDVRLVHDDVDHMVRYSLGDISLPSSGFVDSRPLLGFSANRVYSIQPNYTYNQINNYELFLKQNGLIKIYVNGNLVQNIYKTAGKYDIRDFPVLWGVNEVVINVQYDNGLIERFVVPAFNYSQDLLGIGKHQFTYAIGIPQSGVDPYSLSRQYDKSDFTFSLAHQYGFSNQITGGGYLQGDPHFGIVGAAFSFSTLIGVLSLESALSHNYNNSNIFGVGNKLSFQYIKNGRSFNLNAERRGFNFHTLGNGTYEDPSLYKISSNFSQSLSTKTSFTLAGAYGFSKDPTIPNPLDLSSGLNQSLSTNVLLTTIVKKNFNVTNETSISFQLSWSLTPTRLLTTSYDTNGQNAQARYNEHPTKNINEQVGIAYNPTQEQVDGQVDYIGKRAAINVYGSVVKPQDSNATQNISANFRTAVVYAGGRFAISSPIYDSFVMINPEGRLEDQNLLINNEYSSDFFGPAVISNSTPYQELNLNVNTNELKQGLTLKQDYYTVLPTYKSGTLINLTSESYVSINGTLVDKANKPISLSSGKLMSLKDHNKEEFFFTNQEGRFFIERLEAGDYELTMFDRASSKLYIHIIPESEGLLDYGELKIKGQ